MGPLCGAICIRKRLSSRDEIFSNMISFGYAGLDVEMVVGSHSRFIPFDRQPQQIHGEHRTLTIIITFCLGYPDLTYISSS